MSIIKRIEQCPEWMLISESENTKAFYSIERGKYLVAFLSTGDYCMFDEYQPNFGRKDD